MLCIKERKLSLARVGSLAERKSLTRLNCSRNLGQSAAAAVCCWCLCGATGGAKGSVAAAWREGTRAELGRELASSLVLLGLRRLRSSVSCFRLTSCGVCRRRCTIQRRMRWRLGEAPCRTVRSSSLCAGLRQSCGTREEVLVGAGTSAANDKRVVASCRGQAEADAVLYWCRWSAQ